MLLKHNNAEATTVFLCIWVFGLILFSKRVWLIIKRTAGIIAINCITFFFSHKRKNSLRCSIVNRAVIYNQNLLKTYQQKHISSSSFFFKNTNYINHSLFRIHPTKVFNDKNTFSDNAASSLKIYTLPRQKWLPSLTRKGFVKNNQHINNAANLITFCGLNKIQESIRAKKTTRQMASNTKSYIQTIKNFMRFFFSRKDYPNLAIKIDSKLEETSSKQGFIFTRIKFRAISCKVKIYPRLWYLKNDNDDQYNVDFPPIGSLSKSMHSPLSKKIKQQDKSFTIIEKISSQEEFPQQNISNESDAALYTKKKLPMYNRSFLIPYQRKRKPIKRSSQELPSVDLLLKPKKKEKESLNTALLTQITHLIETRLADYRIKAKVVNVSVGPVVTRFELDPAPGIKAVQISNLSVDLARALSVASVRVIEAIPGKPYIGLELPNEKRQIVYLREVIECDVFRKNRSPLTLVLGKDISGQPVIADLEKMPHLLIAGTTGSGKSVGINAMLMSILYKATPKEVRLVMIDPKMLELSLYKGIPHLLTEVITNTKCAVDVLHWCIIEMERRYKLMSALGVRNLVNFNEYIQHAKIEKKSLSNSFWKKNDNTTEMYPLLERLPYIVVIIDEFSDLVMVIKKKVEELIVRLAQKARAAGIHLVLATQRPSVNVITGLIKANIPTRISFTVSSKIDSRTILDQIGAESLLGEGDMLYLASNSSLPLRVHGAFVHDEEVLAVVQDWKSRKTS
ncbi:DUF87 domain-containing protein [Sodalis sp. CWE]|nr:DUF87 domain-containing protein [Sodalis sp. CWE]